MLVGEFGKHGVPEAFRDSERALYRLIIERMPIENGENTGSSAIRLDIRLLGGVEVILDGQRLRAFDSLRLQRFLALVAVRGDA